MNLNKKDTIFSLFLFFLLVHCERKAKHIPKHSVLQYNRRYTYQSVCFKVHNVLTVLALYSHQNGPPPKVLGEGEKCTVAFHAILHWFGVKQDLNNLIWHKLFFTITFFKVIESNRKLNMNNHFPPASQTSRDPSVDFSEVHGL